MKKQVFKAAVVGLMLLLIGADAGNVTAQEPTLPPLQKKAVFTVNQSAVQVDEAGFTIDVSPYIEKDRIFLPARYLGEVLGAEVIWNEADKEAAFKLQNGKVLILKIGEIFLNNNGKYELMDVAPAVIPPGRICLPARYVCEAAGYNVVWEKDTQQMIVKRK